MSHEPWIMTIAIHVFISTLYNNKANLRDLIAATGLVILLILDTNRRLISPCDLEIWWMTLKNNKAPLLYYIKLCASFQIHRWIQTGVTVRKCSIWVKIGDFFCPAWPWNLTDDLENNRAPLLYYITLCAAFQSHWYIQTGVTVRRCSHYGTSSILRQALCIISKPSVKSNLSYSLEMLYLGKNWRFFCPVWPWNLMDDLEKQ